MQYTHFRFGILVAPIVAVTALACGQVTGLSNDYEFDGIDGGASTDARADGANSEGGASATDGAPDALSDAANRCTGAQSSSATQRLQSYDGTASCKGCLAGSCCTDVDACTRSTDCSRVLECKLNCTTRSSGDRANCFRNCNNSGGGVPALYTNGVGACSAACTTTCAFE